MMYLLTNIGDYDRQAEELGVDTSQVGQFVSASSGHANAGRPFALDNGCFAGFDQPDFERLLRKHKPFRDNCLFVVVPDVPMSARRTLEIFDKWYPMLHGWPRALACQNGQEDLPIPWDLIDAVFIGGDDAWKVSSHARAIVRAAKILGKWTHMGRVNAPIRAQVAEEWGVDSVDGTGISLYPKARRRIRDYNLNSIIEFSGTEEAEACQ